MDHDGRSEGLRQLWVCWKKPTRLPHRPGTTLLSFLPPLAEEELEREFPGRLIRAREVSREVRAEARHCYIDLVARMGTVSDGAGGTLRQALAPQGQASRWWYHPVTFKDCQSDPAFQLIAALLTIRAVADTKGAAQLVLVGAPGTLVSALQSRWKVEAWATERPRPVWTSWILGLCSRLAYPIRALRSWLAVRRWTELPDGPFDVALSGFWDWSVSRDGRARALSDRYFKALPDALRQRGLSSVGWFVWLDPDADPGCRGRTLRSVLAPLQGCREVVVLQAFLRPWDVLRAVADFRPLATFLAIRKQVAFRAVFREEGVDLYPLFEDGLLRGFINASLPHNELVSLATERACRTYRPAVTANFLEHYLHSRAHYEGVRRAACGTVCFAVQHCSYCHGKTFLFTHPALEFRGEPDGCAMPHPDYVCAMGSFGGELFLECGYPKNRVLHTGSPRYDHVRHIPASKSKSVRAMGRKGKEIRLLIVSSLDANAEVDMVEGVWSAARDIGAVKLFLRNHPLSLIQEHPRFAPYRGSIGITKCSLQEDLDAADLILFTYSTVAEEALLQGIPVWQWLPMHFEYSALAETVTVPQFGSAPALRQALREFLDDPDRFIPGDEIRRHAFERLFHPGDGEATGRIADKWVELIRPVSSQAVGHG